MVRTLKELRMVADVSSKETGNQPQEVASTRRRIELVARTSPNDNGCCSESRGISRWIDLNKSGYCESTE